MADAGVDQEAKREGKLRFPREVKDLLRLSILPKIEIGFLEIGNEPTLAVADGAKKVDDGYVNFDGSAGVLRRLRGPLREPPWS